MYFGGACHIIFVYFKALLTLIFFLSSYISKLYEEDEKKILDIFYIFDILLLKLTLERRFYQFLKRKS